MFPIILAILFSAVFASPHIRNRPCIMQNITLTPAGWQMAPTPIGTQMHCTYSFTLPSGYFANTYLRMSKFDTYDTVKLYDGHNDEIKFTQPYGKSEFQSTTNWPDKFYVDFYTDSDTSGLTIEMKISMMKAVPLANVVSTVTTKTNDQPTLLYFNDWKEGTSYTFISESSKVFLSVGALYENNIDESLLQNVFIYDGDQMAGTLQRLLQPTTDYFVSNYSKVTLYLAQNISLTGALFVTDQSNVNDFDDFMVEYVALDRPGMTGFANLGDGNFGKMAAISIIGNKDGSTPIDVRQIRTEGGNFYSLSGGPVADRSQAVKMRSSSLPQHFSGNLNTFFIDQGGGNMKYSVSEQ